MKRTFSISLTLALMAGAVFYLLKPAADGNTRKPERRLPSCSTQQAQERPKSGPTPAASEDDESMANRLADNTRLPEEERAKRLHELLLRWTKRDLAAATAEMGSPLEAVRLVREIVTNKDLYVTESDRVRTFVSQGGNKTRILLQALEVMVAGEMDGIVQYALAMALPDPESASVRNRLAALSVYGTRKNVIHRMSLPPECV